MFVINITFKKMILINGDSNQQSDSHQRITSTEAVTYKKRFTKTQARRILASCANSAEKSYNSSASDMYGNNLAQSRAGPYIQKTHS